MSLADFYKVSMGAHRKDINLNSVHAQRCPKCGMHNIVHTRYVLSITLDSIISGVLTAMVVLWVGFFIGVERAVAGSAAILASIPFVCVLVKRSCCKQCEIEFQERENHTDPTDLEG